MKRALMMTSDFETFNLQRKWKKKSSPPTPKRQKIMSKREEKIKKTTKTKTKRFVVARSLRLELRRKS